MSEPTKIAVPPGFAEWVERWREMPEVTCTCGATFRGVGTQCYECDQREIRRGEAGPMIREFVPPLYRGKGFDAYDCPPGDQRARDTVRAWGGRRGLYLHSQTKGSGKSHLAFALLQAKAGEGRIAALEWSDYLDQRRASMRTRDESLDARLKALRTADLALIDDVGTGQVTDWAVAELWSVVSARYQSARPTLITANYDLPALARRLGQAGDTEAADRIVSRLCEMCVPLEVRATDYRTRRTA